MKSLLIILCVFYSFRLFSQDIVYSKHPNLRLTLGTGIDIRTLNSKISSPFEKLTIKKETDQGVNATTFYEHLILTENDLETSYNLDVKVKARYLTASASAAYNVNKLTILNKKSLSLVIAAESIYGDDVLDPNSISLKKEAKSLIDQSKFSSFISNYGDYLCTGVEKSSKFNVYLTINNISEVEKETIIKSAAAGGSMSGFSASGTVNINSSITKAQKTNDVKISIISNGNKSGIDQLSPLITAALNTTDPIAAITNELTTYMKGFNRENSFVSKYYLVSASSLGIPTKYIGWNPIIELAYNSLYDLKTKNDLLIEDYINLISSKTFNIISDQKTRLTFVQQINQFKKVNNQIINKSYLLNTETNISSIQSINDWAQNIDLEPSDLKLLFDQYFNFIEKIKSVNSQFIHLYPNIPYPILSDFNFPGLLNRKIKFRLLGNNQLGPDINNAYTGDYFFGMPINFVLISKSANPEKENKEIAITPADFKDISNNNPKALIQTSLNINNRDKVSFSTLVRPSLKDLRFNPVVIGQHASGGPIYNNYLIYESEVFNVKSSNADLYLVYRPEQHFPFAQPFVTQDFGAQKLALNFAPFLQIEFVEEY